MQFRDVVTLAWVKERKTLFQLPAVVDPSIQGRLNSVMMLQWFQKNEISITNGYGAVNGTLE